MQDAHRDDGRRGLGALDQFASVDDLTLILRVASRILLSDGDSIAEATVTSFMRCY